MCVFLVQLEKKIWRDLTLTLPSGMHCPRPGEILQRTDVEGILTAFSPLDAMKLKSLSVMNVRQ